MNMKQFITVAPSYLYPIPWRVFKGFISQHYIPASFSVLVIRHEHTFCFYVLLCSCFRASLICINNCPMRCNTNQSIYYSASSLFMFRVSTTPIIRSTENCNYSLRYWSATVQLPQSNLAKLATLEGGSCRKNMTSTGDCGHSFFVLLMMGVADTRNSQIINRLYCISLDNY